MALGIDTPALLTSVCAQLYDKACVCGWVWWVWVGGWLGGGGTEGGGGDVNTPALLTSVCTQLCDKVRKSGRPSSSHPHTPHLRCGP